MKIAVIGGGAGGFFAALAAKEENPDAEVILIEKSGRLLSKVKVSGGGRCNVTHACFDPKLLVSHYPRGSKELLGPFHQFQPEDTVRWFESRGVKLKEEKDGRMFPITDSSQTIIDCLIHEAETLGVKIWTGARLKSVKKVDVQFEIQVGLKTTLLVDKMILATGSSKEGHAFAEKLGHTIVSPVPSLFTFNVPKFELSSLSGVSVSDARIQIEEAPFEQQGPLLVTHFGFSGPCALKLSAWGARHLASVSYETTLLIDWVPSLSFEVLISLVENACEDQPKLKLKSFSKLPLPRKLWAALCQKALLTADVALSGLGKKKIRKLCLLLKEDRYSVKGKTTHKEEFVTCGGIALDEVNFKTMESRKCPGLFFTGEVLDIDGVTGGFNFQNAWTTGFIAGSASARQ